MLVQELNSNIPEQKSKERKRKGHESLTEIRTATGSHGYVQCKFVFKSVANNNVSSFRGRERGRRSTILLLELEEVNKSRSNQKRT